MDEVVYTDNDMFTSIIRELQPTSQYNSSQLIFRNHRASAEQAELDDLRLRQAVMAHHLQSRAANAGNSGLEIMERKKELIDSFLCVETLTPAHVKATTTGVPRGDDSDDDDTPTKLPTCAVCLERLEWGDAVGRAQNESCQHLYHKDCIAEWLLHNMECPLCKRNFLSLGGESDESDNSVTEQDMTE